MSRTELYAELNRLSYIMNSDTNALGRAGEIYAMLCLRNAGYEAEISHELHYGDLRVTLPDGQVLRCEVKTARAGWDDRYRFLLSGKRGGKVETLCTAVDFVVLIAVGRSIMSTNLYVIPRVALGAQQSSITLPSFYGQIKSKYIRFIQDATNIKLDSVVKAQQDAWQIPF